MHQRDCRGIQRGALTVDHDLGCRMSKELEELEEEKTAIALLLLRQPIDVYSKDLNIGGDALLKGSVLPIG
jgi:hypothetical protein